MEIDKKFYNYLLLNESLSGLFLGKVDFSLFIIYFFY